MKNIDIKKTISLLKPFNQKNYENFDLDRLVAYALFILEKKKTPLYFDYITVVLFKLFPKKFSMANFKQYPDTNRISKSLRRLADPKRKNWAKGSIENGFFITEVGREIAIQVGELLKEPGKQKKQLLIATKRSRGRSPQDDVKDIEKSEIFQKWSQKNYKMNDYEVLSFLNTVPYTPKELLLKYLEQLQKSAVTIKNKKALSFLNWLGKKFYHIFH